MKAILCLCCLMPVLVPGAGGQTFKIPGTGQAKWYDNTSEIAPLAGGRYSLGRMHLILDTSQSTMTRRTDRSLISSRT